MANYVKFKRGLIEDFNKLQTKQSDTLYFIYNEDESTAELWLGNRKIAGSSISTLSDLQDTLISEIKDKDLLIYEEGKWINKSIEEIIDKELASICHINRVILNSKDEIYDYLNETNYKQYIFMVPTGLEEDSNKYNEYIILETNDGSRFVEQVGSWEVNLDDYVKRQELNNYVQKDGSARLMTEAEAIKLNSVAENAEENYIKEVSTDFNVVDGKLNLKDGYQLLATTDKQKLDALQINGENLQISGKINTAQIIDLELWLNEHASKWVGLSENNFTTPLKDTLEKLLLIEGIDETQLGLQENNILYVKQITTNQISDLNNLAKASDVTNLQTALNGYQASANKRLDDIEAQLTWQPIGND